MSVWIHGAETTHEEGSSRAQAASGRWAGSAGHEHDPLDVELGRRLRLRRQSNHMTLARLGAGVGISPQQILKYETAANRVSFSMLIRICRVLDLSLADVLREMDEAGDHPMSRSTGIGQDA